ncbi:hypothetical protein [Bartonella queenslandensis]|uniref:hypothetical protein n=1 Tax=Bartonella queenslandensis TaxID=481138 RepID=UPI00058557C3|nr:hypothetical protein [Bartonella queenslandensis]
MRNGILKKIHTQFCRLIGCNTKIKSEDKFVEEWRTVPDRERSIKELIERHTIHTEILKEQEEWYKSKFDNWMKWHKALLAERDKSIEDQQVALENLSSLIKQKNKTLHKQRLKLDLQMRAIDKLNHRINELANKEVRLVDFLLPGETVNYNVKNP